MSENPTVSRLWKEEKKRRELLYKAKGNKKIPKSEKFCSFLKNSLLPRAIRYKFPIVLNNSKWDYLKFKIPKEDPLAYVKPVWTHNNRVSFILFTLFLFFYFGVIYNYDLDLKRMDKDLRLNFYTFLFNYSIAYFFLNEVLYLLYIYNIDLKFFIYSYVLDINYNVSYLSLFSYYIFLYSLNFFVMLNIGLIKYEHDKVLTPPEKWDKIPKMDIDFFDYSEFTELNISDDSLLNYQDNMFNSLCIYEFHLDFVLYFPNIFSIDFFHKLCLKKNKLKKNINKRNYLSNIFYKELLGNPKDFYKDYLPKNFNEFFLVLSKGCFNKLDNYNNIMGIRSFKVRLPYLFFLLYAWYTIYYRNFRYNLYIRSYHFFEEYTCKKKKFILHSNPYGKNRTKITPFRFQKLWTLDHLKLYIEERFFNQWFLLYSKRAYGLIKFYINEPLVNLYFFKNMFNNFNLSVLLKINERSNLEYVYEFFHDNLLEILDVNRILEGFKFAMKVRISKFIRSFRLGKSSFVELEEFVEMMYVLPFDLLLYYRYFNKAFFFDFVLDLFNKFFLNFFFLKDFFNLYNKIDHIKSFKMIGFYDKLIYLSFYVVDPYFFKYFLRKFFPRRMKKLRKARAFLKKALIHRSIRKNVKPIAFNHSFFHHYLNWRTDTSTYQYNSVQRNRFYKNRYSASLSISNIIIKSRFLSLLNKLKYVLNLNKLFIIQRFQNIILLLKIFYTILLNQNIDFVLNIFFFNINKFLNIQNNTNMWLNMAPIIDGNFTYRYYTCFFLFDFNYYIDWFYNRDKRVLWIFHKKDYREHEGALFYKSKYNEMF